MLRRFSITANKEIRIHLLAYLQLHTNVEVIDNKAMISAICYHYHKGVIFYTIFLGVILTVIMYAVSAVNKKKNQFY